MELRCLQMDLMLCFFNSAKMFKGKKENENAADMFFKQQDKNKDGHLDRVSFTLSSIIEGLRM